MDEGGESFAVTEPQELGRWMDEGGESFAVTEPQEAGTRDCMLEGASEGMGSAVPAAWALL
jgi:hypothetical protein